MTSRKTSRRLVVMLVCSALALVLTSAAAAHSTISPPVAKAKTLQQFTLEVQAEKESARTTRVEVSFPDGFNVETFPATPGWKRSEVRQGSGEEAPVQRVIWSGSEKSAREDPVFHFTATLDSDKTYGVRVRQLYSDGSIVDWAGAEGSEQPAAIVEGVSSFRGGNSPILALVALALAGLALIIGVASLAVRGGSRPLA